MSLDTKRPNGFRRATLPPVEAVNRVHRLAPKRPPQLTCQGVAIDGEDARSVVVAFTRPLTDAELRFFHDVLRRTAPLMDGASD